MINTLKSKNKKKEFKSLKDKKEHSKAMNQYRKLREQLHPDIKTKRLAKANAYSKKLYQIKKIEAQNIETELKKISVNKDAE